MARIRDPPMVEKVSGSAVMLATDKSTGVALEMNLWNSSRASNGTCKGVNTSWL